MPDTIFHHIQGNIALPSADPEANARTIVHPTLCSPVYSVGAEAENIPIMFCDSAIRVVSGALIAAQTISSGANNPTLKLQFGDGAGGALTDITATIALTAVTLTARVESAFTLAAGAANIPKGSYIYLNVATNGTPADVDPFSVKMPWELIA